MDPIILVMTELLDAARQSAPRGVILGGGLDCCAFSPERQYKRKGQLEKQNKTL